MPFFSCRRMISVTRTYFFLCLISDAVFWQVWRHYEKTGYFKSEARSEKKFCDRNFINEKGLREANELVTEIKGRLKDKNIVQDDGLAIWSEEQRPLVLKVLYFKQNRLDPRMRGHIHI